MNASPADERFEPIFAEFALPGAPGAAVAVLRDGEVAYRQGYGLADIELDVPVTPATVFNIGSMAKQFTAFGIALLADEGTIALDDDIRTYLLEMADFGHPITIRHLVHHTSGLRDTYPGLLGLAGWREADVTTSADVYRLLTMQRELNYRPGDEFLYVNANYVLLARICAVASGRPFAEFSRDRIFTPLGMTNSTINDAPEKLIPDRSRSYYGDAASGWVNALLSDSVEGPTNVYTSVEDLTKWDRNFTTGSVGGRAVIDLMLQPGELRDGTLLDYAFGLEVGPSHRHRGWQLIEHGGQHGGYCSWMIRFPETELSVVVLCNRFMFETRRYVLEVADLFLEDRSPVVPNTVSPDPDATPAALPAGSEAFCGTYFHEGRAAVRVIDIADNRLRFEGYTLTPAVDGGFTIDVEPTVRVRFITASDSAAPLAMETVAPSGSYRYERVAVIGPVPEVLTQYAGHYFSPELDLTWKIESTGDHLVAHRRKYVDTVLAPVFTDAFRDDWEPILGYPFTYLITFERAADGAIAGFRVSGSRVRRLWFERSGI